MKNESKKKSLEELVPPIVNKTRLMYGFTEEYKNILKQTPTIKAVYEDGEIKLQGISFVLYESTLTITSKCIACIKYTGICKTLVQFDSFEAFIGAESEG